MRRPTRSPQFCAGLAAAAALLAGAGCRDNSASEDAVELLAEVKPDFRSWARAPGYPSRQPAKSPHGDEVEIFVNDVVIHALDGPALTAWPDGSIVVKEGYTTDGALEITAIMSKDGGTWFWAEYDSEDAPLFSGAPTLCTGCHEVGGDFVRSFGLPGGG